MRLEPVPYMTWAKTYLQSPDLHNLGNSGIRGVLSMADLAPALEGLSIWGSNEDGLPALREAIAGRYRVAAENVLLAEGTSLANFLVLAAWIRPGDPVLLEEPYYEPLGTVLRGVGARIRAVAVDTSSGHEALLDVLRESRGTRWRAAVVTNPHNPSGRVLGEDLLTRLADACAAQGALLVVDEAYREILFDEDPPGCAARGRQATVSTSSLTKVYGLSPLRVGWAIGPPGVLAHALRIHDNLGVNHPYLTEAIGARILADSERMAAWRARVRARVDANREALRAFLERHPRFEGACPPDGILAFPRFLGTPRLPDAQALCEGARRDARVVLVPGRFFGRPEHVRIGVGGPEDQIVRALETLARYLSDAHGDGGPAARRTGRGAAAAGGA